MLDEKHEKVFYETLELIKSFSVPLEKESVRGSAIICATINEESLSMIIKAKLAPSLKKDDELFEGAYAPLGNFSAKIDFAYRIGLIDLNDRLSFHIIRKIRNEFAHSLGELTFESDVIINLVKELFKLNNRLLHVFGSVAKEAYKNKGELPEDLESEPGSDFIFKALGWRRVYEMIGSTLAATTRVLCPIIIPIKPFRHIKNNDSI
jgi:DNA-binding MltR family transcriptional regulator